MSVWLWVGLGGAIGACGRYGVAQLVPVQSIGISGGQFPWPTFSVNVLGSLLIGLVIGVLSQSTWFNEFGRAFLVTGILGGFTTFSAFSLEVVQIAQAGHIATAFGYAVASVMVCALGAAAGLMIGTSA